MGVFSLQKNEFRFFSKVFNLDCLFWNIIGCIIFFIKKGWNDMKKKGEMATEQIVLLIILIASFAILLFFLVKLNLGKQTDQEICHNSVITRGNSVIPKDSVPLKCQREYVCLTTGGDCKKMTDPSIKKVSSKEEVYNALSENLANCWWMFGEGKINYVRDEAFSNLYCSICSQVAFDDSLVKIFPNGQIDQDELYNYMETNNYSNSNTYFEYLYGRGSTYGAIRQQLQSQGVTFKPIDFSKQYYSMMGITSDVSTLGWVAGAAILGGGLVLGIAMLPIGATAWGVSTLAGVAYFGGGATAGGTIAGLFVTGESGDDYLSPSIIEANSPEFKSLDCKSITTLS